MNNLDRLTFILVVGKFAGFVPWSFFWCLFPMVSSMVCKMFYVLFLKD